LVSGLAIPAPDDAIPSISKDGKYVYLLYVNQSFTPLSSQQPEAQLFKRVDGQLVPKRTLPTESNFYYISLGYASPDFSKFSVIDAGGPIVDGSVGEMRIRVLNRKLKTIASRRIIDFNFENVMGGTFSDDGRYLLFAYSVPGNSTTAISSNIFVFDATKKHLPTVASTTISGFDGYLDGAAFFTLINDKCKKKLYFVFANSQQYTGDSVSAFPPFFSQVYKVNTRKGTIKLVSQVELPQFAEVDVFVRKNKKEAIVMHGGQCTVNPAKPTIYANVTDEQKGKLPPDFNAIHIFRFNVKDEKLKLLLEQSANCCTNLAAYPPADGTQYLLGQSVDNFLVPGDPTVRAPNPQEFWSLFNIFDGPKGLKLRPEVGPFQDIKSAFSVFSKDGEWLLRTGQYGYLTPTQPFVDSVGIKNVLLFRIKSNKYKKICSLDEVK
jgi:hypothetical protein